jgi:hypothetical protein
LAAPESLIYCGSESGNVHSGCSISYDWHCWFIHAQKPCYVVLTLHAGRFMAISTCITLLLLLLPLNVAGIISDSFAVIQNANATLSGCPSVPKTIIQKEGPVGSSDEGRAMAELICFVA